MQEDKPLKGFTPEELSRMATLFLYFSKNPNQFYIEGTSTFDKVVFLLLVKRTTEAAREVNYAYEQMIASLVAIPERDKDNVNFNFRPRWAK